MGQLGTTATLEYAADTQSGSTGEVNANALGLFPEHQVFVVADGSGGRCRAKDAAALAVSRFAKLPEFSGGTLDGMDVLARAVLDANDALLTESLADLDVRGRNVALCAIRVNDSRLTVVHVGGCRVGRIRGGALEWITEDHSVGAEARKASASPEWLLAADKQPFVTTRAIGVARDVSIDVTYRALARGDVYLMCSDGLTGQVPREQIAELLKVERPLGECCADLLRAARRGGGKRSTTVVLVAVR